MIREFISSLRYPKGNQDLSQSFLQNLPLPYSPARTCTLLFITDLKEQKTFHKIVNDTLH